MGISHIDNGTKGRFFVSIDNEQLAAITYVWSGTDKIIIDHTEVDPKLKGQGLGYKLLASLVAWIREKNIKVIPLCPFAKSVFDKKADYQDVLYHAG
ncbi:MAG: GNAT family N-acetyltransferase [Bacteroidota bacterium]